MASTLISDNCLVNRRYAGNINRYWYAESGGMEFPEHNFLFNPFPFTQLQNAVDSFNEQLKKNAGKLNAFNLNELIFSFKKMLNALLEINSFAIHTQVTSVNSLVIKAETAKDSVYAELFFDEVTGLLNETVVNIIHNQQLQFNNSGSLDAMILAIMQYFETEETDYFTILNAATAYDLSGTALATTDF